MTDTTQWLDGYLRVALSPATLALAQAHAARDRETLARLVRARAVHRDASVGAGVPGARGFRKDIEARAETRNLAIRSAKRKGKKR